MAVDIPAAFARRDLDRPNKAIQYAVFTKALSALAEHPLG